MTPPASRSSQRSLPTSTVRVSGRSSERSTISDLTSPSPPVARATVLQQHSQPLLSPHAPVEENEDTHAILVAKEIAQDTEGGDGGDSDEEGDEFELHGAAEDEEELKLEKTGVSAFAVEKGTPKGILDVTNSVGDILGNVTLLDTDLTNEVGFANMDMSHVSIPRVPSDYVAPLVRPEREEPNFEDVDNPGEWPRYCFQPKFLSRSKNSKYTRHVLPTGAMPVPKNKLGQRKVGDWEFFYKGWSNPNAPYRRGATTANLFPQETEGNLCAMTLKKLGLTRSKMVDTDALFFLQLILPICKVSMSGVRDDPRKSYYHDVECFTNVSKYSSGMGASYGHTWTQVTAKELLVFDGILVRDGVLGGSQGAIYRRWDKTSACYDPVIASAMTLQRFGEIKRHKKLCNNDKVPKRGESKYYFFLMLCN